MASWKRRKEVPASRYDWLATKQSIPEAGMETWLKVAGIVLSPLFAIFLALVMKRPRVCIRIAQYIGGLALSTATVAFLLGVGMFMARTAVMNQAASLYAITTGPGEGADDPWILERLASAMDPLLALMVGGTLLCAAVTAICVAAVVVSRMVLDDERTDGPKSQRHAGDHTGSNSE